MDPGPLLDRLLDDEGLTAGLDAADAELLLRTLADRVRSIAAKATDAATARRRVEAICRRARTLVATHDGRPFRERLGDLPG